MDRKQRAEQLKRQINPKLLKAYGDELLEAAVNRQLRKYAKTHGLRIEEDGEGGFAVVKD